MKGFALAFLLPALFLIGCGQMETSKSSAETALGGLVEAEALTEDEAQSIAPSLMEEDVEVADTGTGNSMVMKVQGVDLFIDFFDQLTGDGDEIALNINGVDIPLSIATDSDAMKGLVTSLVTSHLDGVDIFGLPALDLVNMGLGLINGDQQQEESSNLFGTLIRGALNMFLGGSPIGAIVGALSGDLLDDITGGLLGDDNQGDDTNSENNNNENNNTGDELLGGIVNTIGGLLGGGNQGGNGLGGSALGGIFSLITNLFN